MTITRNGVKITLTNEELSQAHKEFVTNFMMNELMNNFNITDKETAKDKKRSPSRPAERAGSASTGCVSIRSAGRCGSKASS